jgi:hypothetical protein
MLIETVPYIAQAESLTCSVSSCIAMILRHKFGNDFQISPDEIADEYWNIMASERFRDHLLNHSSEMSYSISLRCCYYYFSRVLNLEARLCKAHTDKISATYIKRHIPVIVSGRFPVRGGFVHNTIVMKGYVGSFCIVNDPYGNAFTHYVDRYGENMVYSIDQLIEWVGKETDIVFLP